MKKQISILLSVIMLCSIFTLPASASTTFDYSSFIGTWKNETESQEINVLNVYDGKMDLEVNGNSFSGVPIINNQVEMYSKTSPNDVAYDDYYKLTFHDDSIHLLYSYPFRGVGEMLYYEYWLTSDDAIPRKIEAGNYPVILNGMPVKFDQPPVMCGDRIFVPVRKIFELMNADVYYDNQIFPLENGTWTGQRITAIKSDAYGNGSKVVLDEYKGKWEMRTIRIQDSPAGRYSEDELYAQPLVLSGRTLLPIRAISNACGAKAEWDVENSRVIITGNISGNRKSDKEISAMQSFTFNEAKNIVQKKRYYKKGWYAPEYDEKGKFYRFLVSDDGTQDGKEISVNVYYDGTIVQE